MQRATTLDEAEAYLKILYYGDAKKGKSSAMAGAARLGKMIVVDIEGEGWLARPLRNLGIPVENIIKFRATSYEELEDVYWAIAGIFDDVETGKIPLSDKPIAVAIDHMSDLEVRLLRAAVVQRQAKKRGQLEKLAAVSADSAADLAALNPFVTELQDYGVWTNQANHITRLFRDLPCHVAFGAHYRQDIGKKVPGLTEKYRTNLMGAVNLICANTTMQAGADLAYVGYFREVDGWCGGDRIGVTKPVVVNPSLDRLILALEGKLDFDTDPEQQAFKRALG